VLLEVGVPSVTTGVNRAYSSGRAARIPLWCVGVS
jgi:hypothetical protein